MPATDQHRDVSSCRPGLPVGARNQVTNKVLSRGKRTVAERIVYTALDTVKERTDSTPSPC